MFFISRPSGSEMRRDFELSRMDEVRNESIGCCQSDTFTHILIALFIVFISLLAYLLKRRLSRGNTVLIVGLNDAGKTVLFSKLINRNHNPETYTSLQENRCEGVPVAGDKTVTLIDFPGAERLRKQLVNNYLQKSRNSLKGIVFVIDSSTFGKKSRDVAALLYDVLYESEKKVPVLIACNKQDCSLAKSSQAVRTALEREFGYINGTREAALESIDGGTKKGTLTNTGKNFQWKDLSVPHMEFVECFAKTESESDSRKCEIEPIQSWIAKM